MSHAHPFGTRSIHSRASIAACAALMVVLSVAAVAHAEPGTVHLKNGGRVNGEIMEVRPGEYVTVMLADGDVRRLEWKEVERVGDGETPPEEERSDTELATIFGLELGIAEDELATACRDLGYTWTQAARPICSGNTRDPKTALSAEFKMCDGRACKAVVTITPPEGAWAETFGSLRRSLRDAHGAPVDSKFDRSRCRGDLEVCFAEGRMEAEAKWRLTGGHKVDLEFRVDDNGPRDIAVRYGLGKGTGTPPAEAAPAVAPSAGPPPDIASLGAAGRSEPHWGWSSAGS